MNITVELVAQETDYWCLYLNGTNIGKFEKSQLRQLIGTIDNAIGV